MTEGLTCVPIRCNIFQLPGDGNADVSIAAYLDERFFAVSSLRYVYTQDTT